MKNLLLLIICCTMVISTFANETTTAASPANSANPLDFFGVKHNESMNYVFENHRQWFSNGRMVKGDLVNMILDQVSSPAYLPGVDMESSTPGLYDGCIAIANLKDLIRHLQSNGATTTQINWANQILAAVNSTQSEADLANAFSTIKNIERTIMSPAVQATLNTLASKNFKLSTVQNHEIEVALLAGASVARYSLYYSAVEIHQPNSAVRRFVEYVGERPVGDLRASLGGPNDVAKADVKGTVAGAIIGSVLPGAGTVTGAVSGAIGASAIELFDQLWDWWND